MDCADSTLTADCPVCHAPATPLYRTDLAGAPLMYACPVCGHAAAQPMPRALATDYAEAYTAGTEASRKNRRLAPDYLGKIRPYLPPPPLRFLDVGGSHGWLAEAVRGACSAEVHLLEPGSAAVDAALARGIPATRGFLEDFLPDTPFDVVCATHVIEHVRDPVAFLADCSRVLRPGGVLILLTPNASAWKLARFRRRWAWAVPQDHTLFLSAPSARRLLVTHNFEAVAIHGCVPGLAHYPYFLGRWMADAGVPRLLRWPLLLIERALLAFVDAMAGPNLADELLVVARKREPSSAK